MNAFDDARTIEERSMVIMRPFIEQRAFNGQYVVTSKGPLARDLQKSAGDFLYNKGDGSTVYGAELKCEESNKYGNFFLETWSNLSRFTPGWMLTLQTDVLLYHFLNEDELYVIPFRKLRVWAFQRTCIYDYPERGQKKYHQNNDTWGRCVPIDVLTRELDLQPPFKPLAHFMDAEAAE
jgi:hypothetical protein